METSGDPFIRVGDVRIGGRDVEALRAIDEQGSMHAAAESLGRSYARIQSRVGELEAAAGSLVERQRGGEGGGGSRLTDQAHRLLDRFDRLRAEFDGLARAEESVFAGTVCERTGSLGVVETAAGPVRAIVPADADAVQVSVRSDAVGLTAPDDAPSPADTSVRNRFAGTVTDVRREAELGRVTVDVGADDPLRALVTATSLDTLELAPGEEVVCSFKATAARAVPADR